MPARLSLTMIVKNEAATLPVCLASVKDLVDEIVVVERKKRGKKRGPDS
jgi:glycosyltransferase involved in cell wall biosynthesis